MPPDATDETVLAAARAVMDTRSEVGMPVKALVVYEYLDEQGERQLSWRSAGMETWDRIGFAQTLLMMIEAQQTADYNDEETT